MSGLPEHPRSSQPATSLSLFFHFPFREAKTLKDRENAWDTIEKLALKNPHVTKLASPHKAFKQSMLSHLSPIGSDSTSFSISKEEISDQAQVSIYIIIIILIYHGSREEKGGADECEFRCALIYKFSRKKK